MAKHIIVTGWSNWEDTKETVLFETRDEHEAVEKFQEFHSQWARKWIHSDKDYEGKQAMSEKPVHLRFDWM